MRVMLTRPRADSERLATALQARGNEVILEPMLDIVPAGPLPSLDGITALLVTSANGIRTFAALSQRRDLTVYAVGDASARMARDAGFPHVESAGGDVTALETLILTKVAPESSALLHVHGRDVTGDLASALKSKGYTMRSAVIYEAVAASALSAGTRHQIAEGKIDAILFFSPRTMRTFVTVVQAAGLADQCERILAICLSSAVAEAGSALVWRGVAIAETPDRAAMLTLCNSVQESRKT